MNAELKTYKDLDAWKDFGLWTHEPRLSTLDSRLILRYPSPITQRAGAFKDGEKEK